MVYMLIIIPIVFRLLTALCFLRNPLPATHMYIIRNQPTPDRGAYQAYHVDLLSETPRGRSNLYTGKYYGL